MQRPRTRHRRCATWAIFLWWVAALAPQAVAMDLSNEKIIRWRCTFWTGEVRVLTQDLSLSYPTLVQHCQQFLALHLSAARLRAEGEDSPSLRLGRTMFGAGRIEPWTAQPAMTAGFARSTASAQATVQITQWVVEASQRQGLDPRMVMALIHVESRFRVDALSPKGAIGLMQIMPGTAARYGVYTPEELRDPQVNIEVGTRYLRDLHRLFNGRIELVLAAYNAGEGAVTKYGWQIPPYRETQAYVRDILQRLG